MKAIIYARVSTREQVLYGSGIKHQIQACEAMATSLGFKCLWIFTDLGISGTKSITNRPGLKKALNQLDPNDILLVFKRDRIARDHAVARQVESIVKSVGARLLSVMEEECNLDNELGIHNRLFMDLKAEYELEHCTRRTLTSLYAKKMQGQRIGTVSYGFELDSDKTTLILQESEQTMIKLVQQLRASGHSLRSIVKELNAKGYTGRTNQPLQLTQIVQILKNYPIDDTTPKSKKIERVAPYGFKYNKFKLEPDDREQDIIKHATQLRSQHLSLRRVTEELNKTGYLSRADKPFQVTQVVNMLRPKDIATVKKPLTQFLPYGYQNSKAVKGALEMCSQEREIISLAKDLRANGHSLRYITEQINLNGYRSRANKLFQLTQIARMLKEQITIKVTAPHKITRKNNPKGDLPYGLQYSHDKSTVEPCYKELEIVSFIGTLHNQGFSLRDITQELKEKGYVGRSENALQLTQVARIVKKFNSKESNEFEANPYLSLDTLYKNHYEKSY